MRPRAIIQTTLPNAIIIDTNWAHRQPAFVQTLAADLPIVTCPLPSIHQLGLLMGATDYLPKPVTREDVALAIKRSAPTPAHRPHRGRRTQYSAADRAHVKSD